MSGYRIPEWVDDASPTRRGVAISILELGGAATAAEIAAAMARSEGNLRDNILGAMLANGMLRVVEIRKTGRKCARVYALCDEIEVEDVVRREIKRNHVEMRPPVPARPGVMAWIVAHAANAAQAGAA